MIGDKQSADANVRTVKCPPLDSSVIKIIQTGRNTFRTNYLYKADSPLVPSGLLGPVQLLTQLSEGVN